MELGPRGRGARASAPPAEKQAADIVPAHTLSGDYPFQIFANTNGSQDGYATSASVSIACLHNTTVGAEAIESYLTWRGLAVCVQNPCSGMSG